MRVDLLGHDIREGAGRSRMMRTKLEAGRRNKIGVEDCFR